MGRLDYQSPSPRLATVERFSCRTTLSPALVRFVHYGFYPGHQERFGFVSSKSLAQKKARQAVSYLLSPKPHTHPPRPPLQKTKPSAGAWLLGVFATEDEERTSAKDWAPSTNSPYIQAT
jgi:hypothetical protein